jgi:two-component system chemotaxis response regulator CheB
LASKVEDMRSGPGGSGHPFEIVAIAASAGGLHALTVVLASLPADLPAAVLVVQHVMPDRPSLLASILGRRCPLRVKEAEEGDVIEPGGVYVAPPNHHLLVGADRQVRLTSTEAVHFARPSADATFESAAGAYGAHTLAVVLSGSGLDGGAGAMSVKRVGGTVIVQDPAEAQFDGMPTAAVDRGAADYVLPLNRIAPAIDRLVRGHGCD